VGLVLVN